MTSFELPLMKVLEIMLGGIQTFLNSGFAAVYGLFLVLTRPFSTRQR